MQSKRDDLIEFAHICGQEGIPRNLVTECLRFARKATNYAVHQCNVGSPTPKQRRLYLRAFTKLNAALAGVGASVTSHGDPRGCVVKLRVKSGRTNDMGQEGICVPA